MKMGKLDIIFDKASDRLIEKLDKKAPTEEDVDAIRTLADIVISLAYHVRLSARN